MENKQIRDFVAAGELAADENRLGTVGEQIVALRQNVQISTGNTEQLQEAENKAACALARAKTAVYEQKHALAEQKQAVALHQLKLDRQLALKQLKMQAYEAAKAAMEQAELEYAVMLQENERLNNEAQAGELELSTREAAQNTAYTEWQDKWMELQKGKAEQQELESSLAASRAEMEQLYRRQEEGKDKAAQSLATQVLAHHRAGEGISNWEISELPAAGGEDCSIVRLPITEEKRPLPAADNLSALIAEAVADEPLSDDENDKDDHDDNHDDHNDNETDKREDVPAEPAAEEANGDVALDRHANFWSQDEKKPQTEPKRSFGRRVMPYLACVAIALGLAGVLYTFAFQVTLVVGASMEPTLASGERVLTSSVQYYFSEPEAGDVVIFPSPVDDKLYIKRVIATAGQHVRIADGAVYVDDKQLDEAYLDYTYTEGDIDTLVPEGHLFVLGDNRANSRDSRDNSISCIAVDDVESKAVCVVWPWDEKGMID